MSLYELAFANPTTKGTVDGNQFDGCQKLVATERNRADAVFHLLGLTPLLKEGKLSPGTVIDQFDLGKLVDKMVSEKATVENVLGIEVRSDIHLKPVQELGMILGLIGLKPERVKAQKDKGRKIYRYRIEPESLKRVEEIVEQRKVLSQEEFGSQQYGWSEVQDDEGCFLNGRKRG